MAIEIIIQLNNSQMLLNQSINYKIRDEEFIPYSDLINTLLTLLTEVKSGKENFIFDQAYIDSSEDHEEEDDDFKISVYEKVSKSKRDSFCFNDSRLTICVYETSLDFHLSFVIYPDSSDLLKDSVDFRIIMEIFNDTILDRLISFEKFFKHSSSYNELLNNINNIIVGVGGINKVVDKIAYSNLNGV